MRPPNISDAGSRREDPCYPLDLWEDLPELIQHGLGLNGPGEMDKDFRVHCMVPAQVEQGLTQEVLVIPAEGLNDFSQFRKRVRARTGSKVGVIGDIVIPEEEPKKVSLGETIDTARERLIFLMDASSGAMQRSLEDEKYRRRFLGGVAERLWDDWLAPHLKNPQCPDEDHLALNKWHQVAMREVEAYVTDPNQLRGIFYLRIMNLPIKSGEMRRDEENKRKLLSAAKRRVLEWIYGFVDQYDLSVDWVYQLFLNQAEAQFELEFHNFDDDEWGPWVERVLKVVENRRCGWSHALKVAIEMEVTQYSL